MYVVYGLEDKRVPEIFYVGVTEDVYARFARHLKCDGTNPAKDARILDMRANNIMVGMIELQRVEGVELAKKRESYWIRHYYDLGAPLTNLVIPVVHDNAVTIRSESASHRISYKSKLKAMMTFDEQRDVIISMLNEGMTRKRILSRVDGFIYPNTVNKVLDECMGKIKFRTVEIATADSDALQAPPTFKKKVPETTQTAILDLYRSGTKRKDIQDLLDLNGDEYWMVKAVCDAYDRSAQGGR